MIAHLYRVTSNEKGTYGVFTCNGEPLCVTLELPWNNNKNNISCIPSGEYTVIRHISPSQNKSLKGECYKILDVKGRSDVLIHIANRIKELRGCIAVGTSFGEDCIISSTDAMKKLLKNLPDKFTLVIHNCYVI